MKKRLSIISLAVDAISFDESIRYVEDLATKKKHAYVCFANVHTTIEAHNDKSFLRQVNDADLVLTDGKPLTVACKILHHIKQERISGMDFTPAILRKANEKKLPVFIYGSTDDVISAMQNKIRSEYPDLGIAGSISPPFRPLSKAEIDRDIDAINHSGTHIVLVSLGCPKQEKWMAAHSKDINAVLLGVGAALPVAAGVRKRAPVWMQRLALEWIYRLFQQPKRLFKRYLYTNTYFILLFIREYIKNIFKK